MKVILIVLDSVGIGAAPDAESFGDAGASTLCHIAESVSNIHIPTLESMGLANIPTLLPQKESLTGIAIQTDPLASYGAMQEVSDGKDTITGHWEIAGLEINPGFHVFPHDYPSFPDDLVSEFERQTGRKAIGNKAASGTAIIEELGEEAQKEGKFIIYTSADSVFQIAADIDVIPLPELYEACKIARKLCDPLKVGRVIARPFRGEPGSYYRTEERKDYAFKPEEPTILEKLVEHSIPVYAVGKIEDIYANRGITESNHTGNTEDSQRVVSKWTKEKKNGLIFANFIDFDMLYGHRRDAKGYAKAIEQTDKWLHEYIKLLTKDDILILTADHGNDPTFKGTDHTREYVPLLVYQPNRKGKILGIRNGFYDIAQSIGHAFGIPAMQRGVSFL